MEIRTGIYRLEADREKTGDYYAAQSGMGCTCAGCRNYTKAWPRMGKRVQDFLEQFGIGPGSPAEMSALCTREDGKVLYDGFFHISGSILEGTEPWIRTGPRQFRLDECYLVELGEGSSAYFVEKCALVDAAFPRPVFQLHITFPLPWLLEEENPYK